MREGWRGNLGTGDKLRDKRRPEAESGRDPSDTTVEYIIMHNVGTGKNPMHY